jgi:hypothetical protein
VAVVSRFPFECELCHRTIEDDSDLDWHGYGNCVEITDEMWAQWEKEAREIKEAEDDDNAQSAKVDS